MIKVRTTGAEDYGRFIKMLLVGPPGSGKTLLSSTFKNPLYASAEGGLMSIADRNVPYVEIKSPTDLMAVKAACEQDPGVREQLIGRPVDTLVIDTVDEVQRIFIRERLEDQKKESMALQDWGWLNEVFPAVLRGLRNLEMNVVFTCHLKESQDSESGRVWFEPGLQGQIGRQIPGFVDLSLLLRTISTTVSENGQAVKKSVRVVQTIPDLQHDWIKDRSGKLPPHLEVDFLTDFDRIHELIYGGLDLPAQTVVDTATGSETSETVASVATEEPMDVPSPEFETLETPAEPTSITPTEGISRVSEPEETPVASESILGDDIPVIQTPVEAIAYVCEECGVAINEDQRDLSRIRYRKSLCREHFTAAKKVKS